MGAQTKRSEANTGGGGTPCSTEGCPTKAVARGLCGKHGGIECKASCNAEKKGGYCNEHGGRHGFCANDGSETALPPSRVDSPAPSAVPTESAQILCARGNARPGKCASTCTERLALLQAAAGLLLVEGVARSVEQTGSALPQGVAQLLKLVGVVGNCTTAVAARGGCCKHGGGRMKLCAK